MQAWEQEVGESEVKHAKRIGKDAKILALTSIMLEALFGEAGVFRGRSLSTYADLRASVIMYLDDKVPVSMLKSGSPSTWNFVQNLSEKTQESEELSKRRRQHHTRGTDRHGPAVPNRNRERQE